jgi:hypothetical protein
MLSQLNSGKKHAVEFLRAERDTGRERVVIRGHRWPYPKENKCSHIFPDGR